MAINILYLIFETSIFATLALFIGFLIDYFIPIPNKNEKIIITIFLLFFQIIIGVLLLYFVESIFQMITGRNPTNDYGIFIFIILFYLVQTQLIVRVKKLYKDIIRKINLESKNLNF